MSFLSRLAAELRHTRLTRRGATHRLNDVVVGEHKEYPRMERIALPTPRRLEHSLSDTIIGRRSALGGDSTGSLSLEKCGTLFGLALGKHSKSLRRHYPSAGALFPIETYLMSERLEGQAPGVFHYNPTTHVLERLWDIPGGRTIKSFVPRPDTIPASSLILFTAVWHRTTAKYGDLGFLHALLEAGHMSENILLTATALGLAARPMAGFDDALVQNALDLNTEVETTIHAVSLCAMRATSHTPDAIVRE